MRKERHYCVICGCEIVRNSNRQKYCAECARKIKKVNTYRYVKAYYKRKYALRESKDK